MRLNVSAVLPAPQLESKASRSSLPVAGSIPIFAVLSMAMFLGISLKYGILLRGSPTCMKPVRPPYTCWFTAGW